jgi:hypothetical protein
MKPELQAKLLPRDRGPQAETGRRIQRYRAQRAGTGGDQSRLGVAIRAGQRELCDVIERAVIVSTGPLITITDLPAEGALAAPAATAGECSMLLLSASP